MYENKVVHFTGGIKEYIGRLFQGKHPNGKGWWRINEPCQVVVVQKGEELISVSLARIWGMDKLYEKHIDIYCPEDFLMEIKVLDESGGIYKTYLKEIGRPDRSLILSPTDDNLMQFGKKKH